MGFIMSGHSKWHSIKHKKAATDAKRGKAFSRINKEITIAARLGGGDVAFNPRLRLAVERAKAENMPKENIERAIKKGTGELEGYHLEEVLYEGYGPGGVAILIETTTDNRNRTLPELRHLFTKNGGNMSEAGSVAWLFKKKGYLVVEKDKIVVQLSSCITKDNYHGPPCPHLDYLKELIGKLGLDVREDTSISRKAGERRKTGIYKN